MMNYVTSFIGIPPDYWITCVKQIRLFTGDPIWCITNYANHPIMKLIQNIPNVHCIEYQNVQSAVFNRIVNNHRDKFPIVHSLQGREELFIRCFERFFLCENLMNQNKLEDVLFIEIDNMIYRDASMYLHKFRKKPLSYMRDDEDRSSAGIMYIRDENSLNELNREFLHFISASGDLLNFEMSVLFRFEKHFPEQVQYLPICNDNTLKHFSCIFDAAPLGVYLFGRDPHHTQGQIITGLRNPYSFIDFTALKYYWEVDAKGRRCPWIRFSETESYPIFNLHIHGKNLNEAYFEPQPTEPKQLVTFLEAELALERDRIISLRDQITSLYVQLAAERDKISSLNIQLAYAENTFGKRLRTRIRYTIRHPWHAALLAGRRVLTARLWLRSLIQRLTEKVLGIPLS
jgi:hypothetical protein